jgi:UDPglucose--hexose-1-phosphate uridylyltransferase
MSNHEYRKHYYLDDITIIASGRNKKPSNVHKPLKVNKTKYCQFCNIKEPATYLWPSQNWIIKAVKNLYPAIDSSFIKANGYQEVIIEQPKHYSLISQLTVKDVFNILKAYQHRISYGYSLIGTKYVSIFKNKGLNAGASQDHLHSQMWAMPFVPPNISKEINHINNYYKNNKNCPICDIVTDEITQNIRILNKNNKSLLVSPYSAKYNYEAWIIPLKHISSFIDINEDILIDIASQLYSYTKFIEHKGFDYNLIVHDLNYKKGHVFIKVLPRIYPEQLIAGVELETGVYVNTIPPEDVKKDYCNSNFINTSRI